MNFELMPNELLLYIFNHLPKKYLLSTELVCKRWRWLSNDASLWKWRSLPFLTIIDQNCWGKNVQHDYGLNFSINIKQNKRKILIRIQELYFNLRINNKSGITLMVIPEGLTIDKALKIWSGNPNYKSSFPHSWKKIVNHKPSKNSLLLLTNHVVEGSINLSKKEQQTLLQEQKWELPNLVTLIVFAHFSKFFHQQEGASANTSLTVRSAEGCTVTGDNFKNYLLLRAIGKGYHKKADHIGALAMYKFKERF